jgi:Transposase DDE domain group 1
MQNTVRRPEILVSADGAGIVSHAGALLLTETARVTGLQAGLPAALGRWRAPRAMHDPGKIVLDLVVAVALRGNCLADIGVLRAEPGLFGPVASDPVSRLVPQLAADAPAAMTAIGKARSGARERAWKLAGDAAPGTGAVPGARTGSAAPKTPPDRISLDTAHRRTAPHATRLHVIDVTQMS